ncbi:MAG: hypothetical protein PQJ50_17465 [Spirochaetales bacterium]|nr:hypothetical protein [Spirochaetales bacterium]
MKQNCIENNEVQLYKGELIRDRSGTHLIIMIKDEYLKAKNYQALMRSNTRILLGGDLLYLLLCDLFEYITHLLERIRLEDLDLNKENKALLFLKKFSKSSRIIEEKIDRLNSLARESEPELFMLQLTSQDSVDFTRDNEGNSRLNLKIPVSFIYNRLISFVDNMDFTDLYLVEQHVRAQFKNRFGALSQRILDQKKQIEMKYALELSRERARDLEREHKIMTDRISQLQFQNDLFKRSFFMMKKRCTALAKGEDLEKDIEDLEGLE